MIGLAFLSLLAGLVGSVLPWIVFPGSSQGKRLLICSLVFIGGLVLFFILLGRYEFLMEFLSMEEEVEEIKEERGKWVLG